MKVAPTATGAWILQDSAIAESTYVDFNPRTDTIYWQVCGTEADDIPCERQTYSSSLSKSGEKFHDPTRQRGMTKIPRIIHENMAE